MNNSNSNYIIPLNNNFYLSAKEILDHSVQLKDNTKGKVLDLLFDDEQWVLRYLVVQIREDGIQRFLIPAQKFKSTDMTDTRIVVDLSEEQLLNCPKPKEHRPVSREYEKLLNEYYQIEDYWARSYYPPIGAPAVTHSYLRPTKPVKMMNRVVKEKDIDSSLRSLSEVKGYSVLAKGEKAGILTDLLLAIPAMQITSFVIDLNQWLPWSKKVIIAAQSATEISYINNTMDLDVGSEEVKNADAFDPKKAVNDVLVRRRLDIKGRPAMT